jgi:hypothetical protein
VPAGDPRPLIESLVCWRRVLGLLDEGEERANAFELAPYDTEGFRPFDPCALGSLFELCGGGLRGELTSSEKV